MEQIKISPISLDNETVNLFAPNILMRNKLVKIKPKQSIEFRFNIPKGLFVTKYITLSILSKTKRKYTNLGIDWKCYKFCENHKIGDLEILDSDFFTTNLDMSTLNFKKRYLYNASKCFKETHGCFLQVNIENRSDVVVEIENVSLILHSAINKGLAEQVKQIVESRKLDNLYFNLSNGGIECSYFCKICTPSGL